MKVKYIREADKFKKVYNKLDKSYKIRVEKLIKKNKKSS